MYEKEFKLFGVISFYGILNINLEIVPGLGNKQILLIRADSSGDSGLRLRRI